MKIKISANELQDTEINAVSLVKHGANRIPFAIVKTDETPITIGERLSKMWNKTKKNSVSAVYVKKGTEEKHLKALEAAGFAINCTEENGVSVYKQEDFSEE